MDCLVEEVAEWRTVAEPGGRLQEQQHTAKEHGQAEQHRGKHSASFVGAAKKS